MILNAVLIKHQSEFFWYLQGIMLVYDITQEKTFDNISKWLRNIEEVLSVFVVNENHFSTYRTYQNDSLESTTIITKGKLYCCIKFLFIPFEGFVSLNTQYCEKFQLNLTFIASCFIKASWKKFLLKANRRLKRRKREIFASSCMFSVPSCFRGLGCVPHLESVHYFIHM